MKETNAVIHWSKRFAEDDEIYQRRCKSAQLRLEVLEILNSSDLRSMVDLIEDGASSQETTEIERRKTIYSHMVDRYPGTLSLKLIHVFRRSEFAFHHRILSLCLLRNLFSRLLSDSIPLCPIFISFLKPDLLSCLSRECNGVNFKILSEIVSLFASKVFEWKTGEWDALRHFISSELQKSEPEKGLIIFKDLPLNAGCEFLGPILLKLFVVITKQLKSRKISSWIVAFVAAFNFVLLIPSVREDDLPKHKRKLRGIMVNELTQSVTQLVEKEKEEFVRFGMQSLVKFVKEKADSFSIGECEFLKDLISKITEINDIGDLTKQLAFRVLEELESNSIAAQMLNCDCNEDERESKDRRT